MVGRLLSVRGWRYFWFVSLVILSLLMSRAAARADGPTPTPPQPGSNARTAPRVSPVPSRGSHALAAGVTGITDPTLVPNARMYDFSADAENSQPTSFPGGTFAGSGQILIIGSSWNTWNPQIAGFHVLEASSSAYDVIFTAPQAGAVVKAEPNQYAFNNVTIEAFDSGRTSLGTFTLSINGHYGAAFLGLLSTTNNIASIELTSADTTGFAFSNLTYGTLKPPPVNTVVNEARKDNGMPYPADGKSRGCGSSYFTGCGGPYHGFYLGVCTDLVLDAYNSGASFDIENAMYQAYLADPGSYRRLGYARNADDMRRYFIDNQQWLGNSQPYQPGDIAFFSWNGGPITDHALVVSQVDANGRPLKIMDAPGWASWNPSGVAFEHAWGSYYDQHVQGHARLTSSTLQRPRTASATNLQVLWISLDSASLSLSLTDSNGKSLSSAFDPSLFASNNDAFIPSIPGGSYNSFAASQVVNVTQPLSNTLQYVAEVTASNAAQYHLAVQTFQNGGPTATSIFTQTISSGETQGIDLQLSAPGGVITLSASSPTSRPQMSLAPSPIQISGSSGSVISTTFAISEKSNFRALNGVAITAGALMDEVGDTIPATALKVTPSSFNVAAGGSQNVQLQVNLANVSTGLYLGSLLVSSANGGVQSLPVSVKVAAKTLYLPLITR